METVIVNNVEMVKLSIRDVFQKVDEMFEKFEEMGIRPYVFNVPLDVDYKGYYVSVSLRAVDEKNVTKAKCM